MYLSIEDAHGFLKRDSRESHLHGKRTTFGQKGGKGQEKGLDTKKKHVNKENVFNEYNVNMVMDFNGLQCYYTNADSLPNKLGELKTRIQERDKKI